MHPQQAAIINSDTQKRNNQKYNNELAQWEDNNRRNSNYSLSELLNFYGDTLGHNTYISSSNPNISMRVLSGVKASDEEYKELGDKTNHLPIWLATDEAARSEGISRDTLYHLAPGLSWMYSNAFTDQQTGTPVDVKMTVTAVQDTSTPSDKSPQFDLIYISTNHLGTSVVGDRKVTYHVEFINHNTNMPIALSPIIGVSDIDFNQSVEIYGAGKSLIGSKLEKVQTGSTVAAIDSKGLDSTPSNPDTQAWFLINRTSNFNYSFNGGVMAWHNLGEVTLPGGPQPTLKETLIHYHYDVSASNCSCRTLLLQSRHSKFAKKEPHKRGLIIVYSAFLSLLKSVSCWPGSGSNIRCRRT